MHCTCTLLHFACSEAKGALDMTDDVGLGVLRHDVTCEVITQCLTTLFVE